jgi:ribonucleoside-diphosphate reductase alpha chain
MLNVIKMHREKTHEISEQICSKELVSAAKDSWDLAYENGVKYGYRNAQATVLAPTGTIGFMMDCDTTGIEPDIALVKYKSLAGGGMLKLVNTTVPLALRRLGYNEQQIESICDTIDSDDTIETSDVLKPEHLPVFDCAFKPKNGKRHIHWQAHIRMMAAAQPFLSGAISKTINMPNQSTREDIREAYTEGWKLGLKAIAIYRDGSKRTQPMNTSVQDQSKAKKEVETVIIQKPYRKRLPDTRKSITHKFSVNGHEGYLTVGLHDDGQPGELFIVMAKEGSTVGGLMDVIGTCVSMSLQYGVPLVTLVDKFRHARFEPSGMTSNKQIKFAASLIDYIFCWLGCQFLPGYAEKNIPDYYKNTDDSAQKPKSPKPVVKKETDRKDSGRTNDTKAGGSSVSSARISNELKPAHAVVMAGPDDGEFAAARRVIVEKFDDQFKHFSDDAPICSNCGAITVRNGACHRCYNCGESQGCS